MSIYSYIDDTSFRRKSQLIFGRRSRILIHHRKIPNFLNMIRVSKQKIRQNMTLTYPVGFFAGTG